jgi:hypothetical protein
LLPLLLLLASTASALAADAAPARASLLGSMRRAIVTVTDALPVRIRLGPAGVVTAAQRDSVRRAQLARIARMRPSDPPAGTTSALFVRRGLDLTWWIADSLGRDVRIHRRDLNGLWRFAGRRAPTDSARSRGGDSTVFRGATVEYALELRTPHGVRLVPLAAISISGNQPLHLTARVNAEGEVTLVIELPVSQQATLDLFDVAGRRLGSVDLGGLGVGRHNVPVPRALLPSRGVYFARLQQAGAQADAKVFVSR